MIFSFSQIFIKNTKLIFYTAKVFQIALAIIIWIIANNTIIIAKSSHTNVYIG